MAFGDEYDIYVKAPGEEKVLVASGVQEEIYYNDDHTVIIYEDADGGIYKYEKDMETVQTEAFPVAAEECVVTIKGSSLYIGDIAIEKNAEDICAYDEEKNMFNTCDDSGVYHRLCS